MPDILQDPFMFGFVLKGRAAVHKTGNLGIKACNLLVTGPVLHTVCYTTGLYKENGKTLLQVFESSQCVVHNQTYELNSYLLITVCALVQIPEKISALSLL